MSSSLTYDADWSCLRVVRRLVSRIPFVPSHPALLQHHIVQGHGQVIVEMEDVSPPGSRIQHNEWLLHSKTQSHSAGPHAWSMQKAVILTIACAFVLRAPAPDAIQEVLSRHVILKSFSIKLFHRQEIHCITRTSAGVCSRCWR